MTNLRELARGRECQLRLPGICSFNPDETVLAHVRRGGVAGAGQKPPNLVGIHCCAPCHDALDGRHGIINSPSDTDVLEGLCRTLAIVSKEIDL